MENILDTQAIEIRLKEPESFLVIKESLTRIGILSEKLRTLTQTCHILHKRGRYYLVHFKTMFELDSKPSSLTASDQDRVHAIAGLLVEWGLCEAIGTIQNKPLKNIRVVSYADRHKWSLRSKYTIGK